MHDVGITLVKQKSGEVHLASPIFLSKIFVYGTLMVDEVLSRLGLKINSKFEARLNQYHRVCIQGADYPVAVLTGQQQDYIHGTVIEVNSSDLSMMDFYEEIQDGIYLRCPVKVYESKGQPHDVQIYLKGPNMQGVQIEKVWSLDYFVQKILKKYLDQINP